MVLKKSFKEMQFESKRHVIERPVNFDTHSGVYDNLQNQGLSINRQAPDLLNDLDKIITEYTELYQELLNYQTAAFHKIAEYKKRTDYEKTENEIIRIMLDSRTQRELALRDAGIISQRTAKVNNILRTLFYNDSSLALRQALNAAGVALR